MVLSRERHRRAGEQAKPTRRWFREAPPKTSQIGLYGCHEKQQYSIQYHNKIHEPLAERESAETTSAAIRIFPKNHQLSNY